MKPRKYQWKGEGCFVFCAATSCDTIARPTHWRVVYRAHVLPRLFRAWSEYVSSQSGAAANFCRSLGYAFRLLALVCNKSGVRFFLAHKSLTFHPIFMKFVC